MAIACVTQFMSAGLPPVAVVRHWRHGLQSALYSQHSKDLQRFRCLDTDPQYVAAQFVKFLLARGDSNETVQVAPSPRHPDVLDLPFVVVQVGAPQRGLPEQLTA